MEPDQPIERTATAYDAMQLGLQLERLTQPEVVDADLAGYVARRSLEDMVRGGSRWTHVTSSSESRTWPAGCARHERSPSVSAGRPTPCEAHRRERLSELARRASAGSPFWRERLSGALRADGSLDLDAVPPLTKPEMMERWDDLVIDRRLRRDDLLAHLDGLDHDALWLGEYRAMTTSGSSGLKGLYVYDRAAWRGLLAQFFRYNDWLGLKPRLPRRLRIAAIGGGAPTHMTQRVAATVSSGLHRVLPLAATAPIGELVDRLNEFQPDFMNCYPSVAGLLADEQAAGRLRLRLGSMSTSSELRTAETTEAHRGRLRGPPVRLFRQHRGPVGRRV